MVNLALTPIRALARNLGRRLFWRKPHSGRLTAQEPPRAGHSVRMSRNKRGQSPRRGPGSALGALAQWVLAAWIPARVWANRSGDPTAHSALLGVPHGGRSSGRGAAYPAGKRRAERTGSVAAKSVATPLDRPVESDRLRGSSHLVCEPGSPRCLEVMLGYGISASTCRLRGSLRPSRQPLEPQDEAVYFRQTQYDPYH